MPSAIRTSGSYTGSSTMISSPGVSSAAYAPQSACEVPSAGVSSSPGLPVNVARRAWNVASTRGSSNSGTASRSSGKRKPRMPLDARSCVRPA